MLLAQIKQTHLCGDFDTRYIPVTETGCWLWLGHRTGYGYGLYKRKPAHRVSFEKYHGQIPADMCVCHKCDTKLCVNPDHLFLGTLRENNHDRHRKGRTSRGEKHGQRCGHGLNNGLGNSKLTVTMVELIRGSPLSNKELAEMLKMDRSQISRVRTGSSWGWWKPEQLKNQVKMEKAA